MQVLRFDSLARWIDGITSLWRDRLRCQPRLRQCLPTGNTPKPVYEAMVQSVARRQVTFGDSQIFLLDEFGGLARNDPGRCLNMLRRQLVDSIELPAGAFHEIDIDSPRLDQVCRQYEAAVGEGFDLVLLGLGLNGHLGMNEPGSPADSSVRCVELDPSTTAAAARYLQHNNSPTWGITVGLKQIMRSKEVWLLVNGSAKAPIVHRALAGPVDLSVPASLLQQHRNAWVFLDSEASAGL